MKRKCLKRFQILSLVGIICWGLGRTPEMVGAPPKGDSKTDPTDSVELPPEIPAVPYLMLGLARAEEMHKELGLTAEQTEKLQSVIAEVDEPLWRLRDVPVGKCADQLDSLLSRLRRGLKETLSETQQSRFEQIILQARSWRALITPEFSEKLNLSREQVGQLRTRLANTIQKREETEKSLAALPIANRESARAQSRKAESKKLAAVLNPKQQTELSLMLGQPFNLDRVSQVGCVAPELREVSAWINSEPLTLQQLRGKVVVVHFWAFGCINCIRNLPHYQGWYEKFDPARLTIIGLQTPETEAERSLENLRRQVTERKIAYPVAFDSGSENWKAWGNDRWPSVYLIDKKGRVRNWWYGELNWKGATGEEFMRKRIEELMAEEEK